MRSPCPRRIASILAASTAAAIWVFDVPDADLGEAVIAAVSLAPQLSVTPDIMAMLRPTLARFKHPRRVVVVEQLLRNAKGTMQNNLLRTAMLHGAAIDQDSNNNKNVTVDKFRFRNVNQLQY